MESLMHYNNEEFKERLKDDSMPYHELTISKIDPKTGQVLESYTKGLTKKHAKKGWCTMYKKDMKEALRSLKNHPTAFELWLEMWDLMKKDGTIKMPTQQKLAEKLGTRRQVIGRALKKLRDEKIIEKHDGEWFYNPFLFTISGMSDKEKYEAQARWEELFGYYESQ
jgi:hypothetical protein